MRMNHNNHLTINNKGFTIVELLVVSLLVVLVAFGVFNFMITSGNFFTLNTDKADAQSQARLIFQGIKSELATAKEVQIVDTLNDVFQVDAGEVGYKVEDNQLIMVPNVGGSEPAFNNMALKSLQVQFIPLSNKLVKMIVLANEGMTFETEIYSPNILAFDKKPSGLVTGNAIVIRP